MIPSARIILQIWFNLKKFEKTESLVWFNKRKIIVEMWDLEEDYEREKKKRLQY